MSIETDVSSAFGSVVVSTAPVVSPEVAARVFFASGVEVVNASDAVVVFFSVKIVVSASSSPVVIVAAAPSVAATLVLSLLNFEKKSNLRR